MIFFAIIIAIITLVVIKHLVDEQNYRELKENIKTTLGYNPWSSVSYIDDRVVVKSRQALEKYDVVKFFRENSGKLIQAKEIIEKKNKVSSQLRHFVKTNTYKSNYQYNRLQREIDDLLLNASEYRINVDYITSAGNKLDYKILSLDLYDIEKFEKDPTLLMTKGEHSKYLKEQEKDALTVKQHNYYEKVNKVIDYANKNKEILFIKGSEEQLDNLINRLFDRTVNSIKKVKSTGSEEWGIIGEFIDQIQEEVDYVVNKNKRILDYYESEDFLKIKETCESLMSTQREFNEYISEKVESISRLFGTRIIRNETINDDEYQYIRPYKKTVTPFTAELSATVFASAENNPLEYVIKNFYPNKALYPEQIQKLHLLVEELATLKEAKQIIENYKKDYQQYLVSVPNYVMEEDEAGFYSRLGFANIDESVLVVEYKFSYTSGGGMAKRTFAVPMTEETIVELVKALEGKLTASAFTKEQRALMTNKLREHIKNRDNFTCCNCGNSSHIEPNLLLEIDHIIPVSRGGCTVEENLQTLCWKCNRAKSNKVPE